MNGINIDIHLALIPAVFTVHASATAEAASEMRICYRLHDRIGAMES
jgi:hypothetical protein